MAIHSSALQGRRYHFWRRYFRRGVRERVDSGAQHHVSSESEGHRCESVWWRDGREGGTDSERHAVGGS